MLRFWCWLTGRPPRLRSCSRTGGSRVDNGTQSIQGVLGGGLASPARGSYPPSANAHHQLLPPSCAFIKTASLPLVWVIQPVKKNAAISFSLYIYISHFVPGSVSGFPPSLLSFLLVSLSSWSLFLDLFLLHSLSLFLPLTVQGPEQREVRVASCTCFFLCIITAH